ncbi:hypothetical protein BDP27DRAFT_253507 [Rhodocollybia butyracea]|uniref:Uncharacterized protein n=1 Tax=Rhodocollybia butyracea TaxID=206335 RepID=A0A9P5PI46_9AGAR|nr:hypothetical protein BDP27DRAFT_253507 [Rhodocollybia butyracea]
MLFDRITVITAPTNTSIFNTIFSSQNPLEFYSFILANPSRAQLFKHLKCPPQAANQLGNIRAVLPLCTQLRSLTVQVASAQSIFAQVSLRSFPVLRKLVLTNVLTFPSLIQFFESILDGIELEDLSLLLDDTYAEQPADILEEPRAPPLLSLRAFSLFNDNQTSTSPMLLDYLYPILLRLRRLVIRTNVFLSPDIAQLIEANTRTLKSLDLSYIFDLSDLFPRLVSNRISRDLVVHLPILSDELANYLVALARVFLELDPASMSLRCISFLITSSYTLVDLGHHCDLWARLADALCRFPHLEVISLLLEVDMDSGPLSSWLIRKKDLEVHPAFENLRTDRRLQVMQEQIIDGRISRW